MRLGEKSSKHDRNGYGSLSATCFRHPALFSLSWYRESPLPPSHAPPAARRAKRGSDHPCTHIKGLGYCKKLGCMHVSRT